MEPAAHEIVCVSFVPFFVGLLPRVLLRLLLPSPNRTQHCTARHTPTGCGVHWRFTAPQMGAASSAEMLRQNARRDVTQRKFDAAVKVAEDRLERVKGTSGEAVARSSLQQARDVASLHAAETAEIMRRHQEEQKKQMKQNEMAYVDRQLREATRDTGALQREAVYLEKKKELERHRTLMEKSMQQLHASSSTSGQAYGHGLGMGIASSHDLDAAVAAAISASASTSTSQKPVFPTIPNTDLDDDDDGDQDVD